MEMRCLRRPLVWMSSLTLMLGALRPNPCGANEDANAGRTTDSLQLVWFDVTSAAPFAYEDASGEAARILASAGAPVSFRRADPEGVTEEGEIQVILLANGPSSSRRGVLVMGAAKAAQPIPSALWIYVSEVMSALGHGGERVETLQLADRQALSRAIGRVVAHEVLHVVAPGVQHSKSGLMAATLRLADLVGTRVDVAPPFRASIRRKLVADSPDRVPSSFAAFGRGFLPLQP